VIYHPPKSNDSDKKHEQAVKELQRNKKALEQELAVYQKQASILEAYAGTLKGEDTDGKKLEAFLDIYAERQSTIDIKTTELSEKITTVDEHITAEKEVWSVDKEGKKRAARITIIVYAEEDGAAEISLTYREFYVLPCYQSDSYPVVSNASWTPLYDLRARVGADKTEISLQYRATIKQSTGEDWKDVELTLSTASPQLGSTIPKLYPQRIDPIVQYRPGLKSAGFGRNRGAKKERSIMSSYGSPIVMAMRSAVAVEGMISTSYEIEGLSNIPTDTDLTSQEHKVSIAVIDLKADLEWIAVPRVQPSAFLQAKVKNTSEYLLLPGRANIFLDDNFVAKSSIEVGTRWLIPSDADDDTERQS
jgi:uncharacterized protein (TIGR02231 family)